MLPKKVCAGASESVNVKLGVVVEVETFVVAKFNKLPAEKSDTVPVAVPEPSLFHLNPSHPQKAESTPACCQNTFVPANLGVNEVSLFAIIKPLSLCTHPPSYHLVLLDGTPFGSPCA